MKNPKLIIILISIIGFTFCMQNVQAQESDKQKIFFQRSASNEALRAFDDELNASFSTEDALITTGAGILISGKKGLMKYIQESSGPRMYWIRTPDEVLVNPRTMLAWETGTWKGYIESSDEAVVGGKYSAQWTKASGTWLIKSQLFVTLEN